MEVLRSKIKGSRSLAVRGESPAGVYLVEQMADPIDYEYEDWISRIIVTKRIR